MASELTVQDFITIGREWGLGIVFAAVFGYGFWKLVWYIIRDTVPRDMYENEKATGSAELVDAVKANTSSIEMLKIVIDERVPKQAGR